MRRTFDCDIDVKSSTKKEKYGRRASLYNKDKLKLMPHPSGYFIGSDEYEVAIDPDTGLTAIEAKEGEEIGYYKVDLLTNTVYDRFQNKQQILDIVENEENHKWHLLMNKDVVERLPHIHKHFTTVRQVAPTSIQELADVLALIRPGKSDLLEDYLADREKTRKRLYKRPLGGGMYFKKSHSIAYATAILVAMSDTTENLFFD